jgi:L-proline 4-hydroxylase
MNLTARQVEDFHRRGFLFLERAFAPAEVAVLDAALPEVLAAPPAKVVLDAATGSVRMSRDLHLVSEPFRRLARHPRLAAPAMQLLGGPVFLFQTRLNLKVGMERQASQGYPWHQDFSTWHFRDGLPEPRAVVAFVFLDDVTPCNAPLLVIPGSHRGGLLAGAERPAADGYRHIDHATLRELCDRGGVEAALGAAGSALLMHCNLAHASTENISPLRRALCSIVFSACDNRPAAAAAPGTWDLEPIHPLADGCLLERLEGVGGALE